MANAYQKHIWLLETLHRFKKLNYEDLNERWLNSWLNDLEEELSKRTLKNHIDAIYRIYGIRIECEKCSPYRYYIASSPNEIAKAQQDAFITNSIIQECMIQKKELQGRVVIPKGFSDDKVVIIVQAMDNRNMIQFQYTRSTNDAHRFCAIKPYFITFVDDQWFVIGKDDSETRLVAFVFKWVDNIEVLDETFEIPSDFVPESFLEELKNPDKDFSGYDNMDILHRNLAWKR